MSFRHPRVRVRAHIVPISKMKTDRLTCVNVYTARVTFLSLMSPTTFVARVYYTVAVVTLITSLDVALCTTGLQLIPKLISFSDECLRLIADIARHDLHK